MYKLFLLGANVLMNCKNTNPSGNATGGSEGLYQHKWLFTDVGGKPITSSASEKAAFLAFTPGQVVRVSGTTGCNNLTGTAEIKSGNGLHFSPMATTKMFCAETATQEQTILAALAQVTNFSVTNGTLVLLKGTTPVASLKAE